MSDQYVFELQFKGKPDGSDYRENQFVIIDGSSMANFSRLKEDLSCCMPEPFQVQYLDDEDDVISIDTEEEFQEFARIAKKRSSRGMLMRLILNSNIPLDHGQYMTPSVSVRETSKFPRGLSLFPQNRDQGQQRHRLQDVESYFKEKIKAELKNEILSELKELGSAAQLGAAATDAGAVETAASNIQTGGVQDNGQSGEESKEAEYEEDSDGNMYLVHLPEKSSKKTKLMHQQKKLEKKEKLVEAKIDQRLEKLEMKRKKLMEKYNIHKMCYKPTDGSPPPIIISAIATKESSVMSKRVGPGKLFQHAWTIVNDGTVGLNNVELRHTWSSPGLEPIEPIIFLAPLLPGQQCSLAAYFKAPGSTLNRSFISYWQLYRFADGRWHEFGHYVSLTGSIKPPKSPAHETVIVQAFGSSKKPRPDDKKVVSFSEAVDAVTAVQSTSEAPKEPQEEKVMNEESLSNITLKKQMEQLQATLASSEIAADMAREAARLLALASATEGNTSPSHVAPKPSEGEKLSNCELEEAAAAVQQLNLVDSESDTDANMETVEDSDRGFVMVSMNPEQSGATKDDDKTVPTTDNYTKEETQTQPKPMTFPRLESNMNYPVLPPPPPLPRISNPPVYMPQTMIPPHNVYNYSLYTPSQNGSSHGMVFPPPVNYSQIPTYPPIPFHQPSAVLPLAPLTPFPVSQPMGPQQGFNPFSTRQTNEKIFWTGIQRTDICNQSKPSAASPTDKPAATETPSQEMHSAEDCVPDAPKEEEMQMEQPQQPQQQAQQQPQPKAQQQPQQQAQQQQQQQQQPLQQTEATPQTAGQNKGSPLKIPGSDSVQILPQALVDGAINVAATAYSTAWNALNNLRPKEGEASEFDPVFENNMAMLVEMGFNNLERNGRLLKRFNNDISQVIGVICSTSGSHNLDID